MGEGKKLPKAKQSKDDKGRYVINKLPRAEWIREQYAEGHTRGAIAKHLDVAYQVVFQATKPKQSKTKASKAGEATA